MAETYFITGAHGDDAAIRTFIGDLPSTPLEIGVRETMDRFTALRDAGTLDTTDLQNA